MSGVFDSKRISPVICGTSVAPSPVMDLRKFADVSYILPVKAGAADRAGELAEYLGWLSVAVTEVIVVDASSADVFEKHNQAWTPGVQHVAPFPHLVTPMGKVGNVLTGVQLASCEKLIIADDDVRYDRASLERVATALDIADVVRPQNFFHPTPWHARWDTARILLNRMLGGDWPGTLGVRRSVLRATNGYDGNAMFENLELVRTVVAAGGKESVIMSTYVLRTPSTESHFWSQRIRQAYDEFARPGRLLWQLALLPGLLALAFTSHWLSLALFAFGSILLAEAGRHRAGGSRIFPASASLFAPAWLAERALCSWLAIASRVFFGGIRYRGTVLRLAANPVSVLRSRHRSMLDATQEPGRVPRG